eukprot:c3618_g1_i1.p1 GENE.c3618_g1_i1~~c3618_g1_i1.p1  ORF type:complete len:741 (-),score=190.11 c3618_g1_i1:137-2314(-)
MRTALALALGIALSSSLVQGADLQCSSTTNTCLCLDTNGREVIGSRRSTNELARYDCTSLPTCVAQSATARNQTNQFVPNCLWNGMFATKQCDTQNCWCALSSGVEIVGTRSSSSQFQFDCSNVPKCLVAAQSARTILMAHVPQCDSNGNYVSAQSHGSTGQRWCVDSNGLELPGTRTLPGQVARNCSSLPVCSLAVLNARTNGGFVSSCQDSGTFETQQCDTAANQCWCVLSSEGREILGTRRATSGVGINCSSLPQCVLEAHNVRSQGPVGAFIPQCLEDGSYAQRQRDAAGNTWCVDTTDGEVLEGTRTNSSQQVFNCSNVPNCWMKRHDAAHAGTFVPTCTATGAFESRQCSNGYCWCVDSSGNTIANTNRTFGTALSCDSIPVCWLAAHLNPSRSYVCSSNGNFAAEQCDSTTKECWCTDTRGNEVQNTRRLSSATARFSCSELPKCVSLAHSARYPQGNVTWTYIPQCQLDGTFVETQCDASRSQCWCVDSEGVENTTSRRVRGQSTPECPTKFREQCELDILLSQSSITTKWRPECDGNGNYIPKQCNRTSGSCWCVDTKGGEILGTRSFSNAQTPITDMCWNLPLCISAAHDFRQNSSREAYVPQCDASGNFSAKQCDVAKGTCWCSTTQGVEVPNTRTSTNTSALVCSVRYELDAVPEQEDQTQPTLLVMSLLVAAAMAVTIFFAYLHHSSKRPKKVPVQSKATELDDGEMKRSRV